MEKHQFFSTQKLQVEVFVASCRLSTQLRVYVSLSYVTNKY